MQKLCIGVDVSKKTLDVAYWDDQEQEAVFLGKYANTHTGFHTIREKIEERRKATSAELVHVTMEPSGGYEQPFAHFVDQQDGWDGSLPNPVHPKRWAEAIGKRAKTDSQDARTLAHYCFVRNPPVWKPLPAEVEQLEHLLDRLDNLQDMLSREKNRLGSVQYHVKSHEAVYDDLRESITSLEDRIEKIQGIINDHLDKHPHLEEQRKILLSVPGVGVRSVLYILITMNRWGAFTHGEGDANGIVALLGLDPRTHESGTSVRKRGRISRQGDRSQRSRLYMCALGGVRGNNPLRAFYERLVGRGKPKKLALVAAARKIVVWCWAVFRSNIPFDAARFDHSQ